MSKSKKKVSKKVKSGIHLQKEVKKWAKENGHDPEEVIKQWIDIRTDHKDDEEGEQKDMQCFQELVLKLQAKKGNVYSSAEAHEFVGTIMGLAQAWTKNEQQIKNLIEEYQKTGEIGKNKDKQPTIIIDKDGKPIPVAYNKTTGNSFPLRVDKDRAFLVFGKPVESDQEAMLIQITINGQFTNGESKEKMWFVDYIDEIPLGKKCRFNVSATSQRTFLHKSAISSKHFDVIEFDDDESYEEFIEDLVENDDDFVIFDEIEDYIKDNRFVSFISEGSVINVGTASANGSYNVAIGQSVSALFGKTASMPITGWLEGTIPKNFKKGTKVRFFASGYYNDKGEMKLTLYNVIPEDFDLDLSDLDPDQTSLKEFEDEDDEDEEEETEESSLDLFNN